MLWIFLAIISALLLGVYDIFKKLSLKDNAVIPVLFFSTLTSAFLFIPLVIMSQSFPELSGKFFLFIPSAPVTGHILFAIKSIIVGSSWILAYFAMKHLPVTIVSPIRSSGPLWTILGALIVFGEQLSPLQWLGVSLTLFFYYLFSLSGLKEGISFRTNKWVLYMTIATLVGSVSSLFDKYLLLHYNRFAMQAWYHIYMVPLMATIFFFVWYPNRHKYAKFEWRYTILLIGICLTVADFLYFWSLSMPDSLVAIVSTVRRASVIVSFSLGALLFHEKNIKRKAWILLGIMIGIGIIVLS
jgi:transporter family protein